MLSIPLTDILVKELKELHDKMALSWASLQTLSEAEQCALREFVRVSEIGASTRIENAVLTDPEILWMDTLLGQTAHTTAFHQVEDGIRNKLSKDKQRSIEEVAGCREFYMTISEQARDMIPLSAATLRGLHQQLMKYYPPASHHAGCYKQVTNSVVERSAATGLEKTVFQTADPGAMTETSMSDLISWYNQAQHECAWSFAVACEFVFRFLAIHPFLDGNGRMGRGLFLLVLLQSRDKILNPITPYLAINRQIERHRSEYYRVLQLCSGGKFSADPHAYHMEFFLRFMIRMTEFAIRDIAFIRNKYSAIENLSRAAANVWECLKDFPEKCLQTGDILTVTRLPRRTIVHALHTLVSSGLIRKRGRGPATRYQVVF